MLNSREKGQGLPGHYLGDLGHEAGVELLLELHLVLVDVAVLALAPLLLLRLAARKSGSHLLLL